ncbi:Zn(2)-C6 fungal-type domain-containing protein [Trichoderma simmonsii]|uniref:Zn(2)-C6 fungal-type domain-containing protein n=2 Tax=Trichoderma simmonsii TaxID=1491479 RepID=A0A8G0L3X8_9HYPO|nr:Zn(2)-C6 fungal-type domain-containing protein [Trichoderma simmonsii]
MERYAKPRVSVACLPCRNQHLKCDASHPTCARCRSLGRSCSYPESRRSAKYRNPASWKSRLHRIDPSSSTLPSPSVSMSQEDDLLANPELCISPSMLSVTAPVTEPASGSTIPSVNSHLLDLYYEYFHPSHPFLLPRRSLDTRLRSGPQSPTLQQLTTTMEYIGSFYRHIPIGTELFPSNDTGTETDGFVVQNTLLRAMAKSMCDDKSGAEVLLARAIQQASFIGMHEKSFASTVANGDPILAESWRRTWWMLYLTDANLSVTRRDFVPIITTPSHDVGLPCEDASYEQMDIPLQAATLLDYRSREFALDDKPFSSFAYLIDATEIFIAALRASTQYQDIIEAESLCGDLEARVISWFLMLPLNKRELTVMPGLMDQLMFQSHMMMYTSLAFIHRPLSNLRYDPAEDISSCGPPPPPLEQNSGYTRIAHGVHSEKLFQAIRKQTQCLILLPMRAAQLSPFVICMIACSTIAYLVASKLALKAEEAEAARSRIRISLATLRMYEDAWPRAKKILMELKRIAQAILQSATVSPTLSIDSQLLADESTVTASFFDNEWLCAFENTTS